MNTIIALVVLAVVVCVWRYLVCYPFPRSYQHAINDWRVKIGNNGLVYKRNRARPVSFDTKAAADWFIENQFKAKETNRTMEIKKKMNELGLYIKYV